MSDARRYNCVSFDSIDNAPGYYCVKHLRIKIIGLATTYFTIWIVKVMRLAIIKLRFG